MPEEVILFRPANEILRQNEMGKRKILGLREEVNLS